MRMAIVLDCADPDALLPFWAGALGYRQVPESLALYRILVPDGKEGPNLVLQRVDEPKVAKNRMHIDVHVEDLDAEVERLVALGARRTGLVVEEGGYRWEVLTDPEGNELCAIQDP